MANGNIHPSSFRDPCGFLYSKNGTLYRQVNSSFKIHYDHLIQSGLYDLLINEKLLVPHQEVGLDLAEAEGAYKVLQPELIDYISYPYEWCFSQLKDAALTTLKIQKLAIKFDMILKDASAYNIQFLQGKPIFIDTLSFEKYREGTPWVGYRQFCQHFLGPLALMSYRDVRLKHLLWSYIDGLPIDLVSSLLPWKTYFRFSLLSHIHLHAHSQTHHADSAIKEKKGKKIQISRMRLKALIESLKSSVEHLRWDVGQTEWGNYYQNTNYDGKSMDRKTNLIGEFLKSISPPPKRVLDLGANTGVFSRISSKQGINTISMDIDEAAVEKNYLSCRKEGVVNILPLVLDLTNPCPDIGWANEERMSFIQRVSEEVVMALALIHHLAISNNVPLIKIAEFFCQICRVLIIEFVPKSDSQVQRLLATREDIFPNYTEEGFEEAFVQKFRITRKEAINNSKRILYLLEIIPG